MVPALLGAWSGLCNLVAVSYTTVTAWAGTAVTTVGSALQTVGTKILGG